MEKERIFDILAFYSALNRPITPYELWREIPAEEQPENFLKLLSILAELESSGLVKAENNLLYVFGIANLNLLKEREAEDNLLKIKWRLILKYRKLFNLVPFLDFALIGGSVAIGNVNPDSDFDFTLGVKDERIFTARLFIIAIFELFGRRKRGAHSKKESKDKFCFNHFVTLKSYRLRPPHDLYWQILYRRLVPIYGSEEKIIEFFRANNWAKRGPLIFDNRFSSQKRNPIRLLLEFFLESHFGDFFEWWFKKLQLIKIAKNQNKNLKEPYRLLVTEKELEFHPEKAIVEKIEAVFAKIRERQF